MIMHLALATHEIFLDFSEFCDVTYRKIIHHISVRWLSLQAAVDRALQQYTALCSFFQSYGSVSYIILCDQYNY